jgi:hypothetical protein
MNLKGILVGNGVTDWRVDGEASMMEFAYMHNIIDQKTFFRWRDNKCETYAEDIWPGNQTTNPLCKESWDKMNEHIHDINPYDIYRDDHIDFYQ